jgi:hypothetical protein
MMPDTRGRTSETLVGATRPGNSRTSARACGLTVTKLTSGSEACAADAEFGSSHPASSGAMAASINAIHADCARNPVIEGSPKFEFDADCNSAHARRRKTLRP